MPSVNQISFHTTENRSIISPDGKEIKQHGTPDFPCGCYSISNGLQVPWHWHEEYECTIVMQGEICYHTPQGEFLLHAGDGIFLNSGTLHTSELVSETGHSLITLVFHGRLVYGSIDSVFYHKYTKPLLSPDAPALFLLHKNVTWQAAILDRMKKAHRLCQNKPEGYEFQVRTLLSETLFDLYCYRNVSEEQTIPVSAFENDRIKQMLSYLQENYTCPISVSELAERASISERECLRCFQKVLRLSPIQFLIRYRLSRACILLKDTDLSILEIANSCGFESPSYFTKTFREHAGCTPRAYRQKARQLPTAKT
ncbi:MAG: helix-turn-helix domain-containing protein [Muricoprocola sp.]